MTGNTTCLGHVLQPRHNVTALVEKHGRQPQAILRFSWEARIPSSMLPAIFMSCAQADRFIALAGPISSPLSCCGSGQKNLLATDLNYGQ